GVGMPKLLKNCKHDAAVLSQFDTFGYDGVFNMTAMSTPTHASSLFQGANTWTYDSKDRLTQEIYDQTSGNSIDYTSNFACDDAGNNTTFKGSTWTFN